MDSTLNFDLINYRNVSGDSPSRLMHAQVKIIQDELQNGGESLVLIFQGALNI